MRLPLAPMVVSCPRGPLRSRYISSKSMAELREHEQQHAAASPVTYPLRVLLPENSFPATATAYTALLRARAFKRQKESEDRQQENKVQKGEATAERFAAAAVRGAEAPRPAGVDATPHLAERSPLRELAGSAAAARQSLLGEEDFRRLQQTGTWKALLDYPGELFCGEYRAPSLPTGFELDWASLSTERVPGFQPRELSPWEHPNDVRAAVVAPTYVNIDENSALEAAAWCSNPRAFEVGQVDAKRSIDDHTALPGRAAPAVKDEKASTAKGSLAADVTLPKMWDERLEKQQDAGSLHLLAVKQYTRECPLACASAQCQATALSLYEPQGCRHGPPQLRRVVTVREQLQSLPRGDKLGISERDFMKKVLRLSRISAREKASRLPLNPILFTGSVAPSPAGVAVKQCFTSKSPHAQSQHSETSSRREQSQKCAGGKVTSFPRVHVRGRGILGKWGPNRTADVVLTAINPTTNKLQVALIRRTDGSGQYAFPGGFVDEDDFPPVLSTAVREFLEEAVQFKDLAATDQAVCQAEKVTSGVKEGAAAETHGSSAALVGALRKAPEFEVARCREAKDRDRAKLQLTETLGALKELFGHFSWNSSSGKISWESYTQMRPGNIVYAGYVDDKRNTDNAWIETVAIHWHVPSSLYHRIHLQAGDDAAHESAAFYDIQDDPRLTLEKVDPLENLYSSHSGILKKTIQMYFPALVR